MRRVANKNVSVHVAADELDAAIEKASRLVELLKEARDIIGSLSKSTIIQKMRTDVKMK